MLTKGNNFIQMKRFVAVICPVVLLHLEPVKHKGGGELNNKYQKPSYRSWDS
jgi:hypothetical protein